MAANPEKADAVLSRLKETFRIFFVDDDPILREFAVVNLANEYTKVETAPDGQAALAAMEARPPDILLLNLEAPNADGFEALRRLREDDRHPNLAIVVVTGREDVEAVDRAFAAGASSFVVKPLNWRLLSHQLRYVHRTTKAEQVMRARCEDALRRLQALALEGGRFVAQALAHDRTLAGAAAPFVKAADAALPPPASRRPPRAVNLKFARRPSQPLANFGLGTPVAISRGGALVWWIRSSPHCRGGRCGELLIRKPH
ncbi:MAG: response regulator [Caulobacteraceae bacterium]|nr:response regulator [Caulobacteraceae bacterium]